MRLVAVLLALTLCGCATNLPVAESAVDVPLGGTRTATFEYLGAGGWLIRKGNDAVLTAPFFSNPGHARVFLRIGPNTDAVRKHLQLVKGGLDDVRAVVAGHAHYDHIMDLPEVVRHLPMNAWVVGGNTVCNSLGRKFVRPCVPVTDRAGTRYHQPIPFEASPNVRIRPYFSEHASHYWRLKLFNGHLSEMSDDVPPRPSLWREGETLAYLIDFLDENGEIEFRVYYNDAAPNSPFGLPDAKTLERKVDVAILCVASYGQQADYPKTYLDVMQPKHVLLGHWENFFASIDGKVKPVTGTNVAEFVKAVNPYPFTLPNRHTVVTVKY